MNLTIISASCWQPDVLLGSAATGSACWLATAQDWGLGLCIAEGDKGRLLGEGDVGRWGWPEEVVRLRWAFFLEASRLALPFSRLALSFSSEQM